jgi:hypothetical protein
VAFFGEDSKNFAGESGVGLGMAKKLMHSGDRAVDEGWGLSRESEVEWELEFAADDSDAADDIGAVDGTSVPGVRGTMECFHKYLVGVSIVACDRNAAVENTKEALDAHGFVVAASGRVEFQFKQGAHGFEEAAKSAAGVDNNGAGEANFEEELLHENVSEIGRGNVGDAFGYDHTGKIAHGGEDIRGAVGNVGGVAGFPKIDVKDVKGAADRPRE